MMYYSGYSSLWHLIQSCAVQCSLFTVAIMKLNVYTVELTCLFAFLKIICWVVLGLSTTYSLTLRWHHFIVLHFSFISGLGLLKCMQMSWIFFTPFSAHTKKPPYITDSALFRKFIIVSIWIVVHSYNTCILLWCNSNIKLFKLS